MLTESKKWSPTWQVFSIMVSAFLFALATPGLLLGCVLGVQGFACHGSLPKLVPVKLEIDCKQDIHER